uniref:Cation/H+ exchanger, cation/H+ exchanger, CPA1 family n=1 Tax=Tanacetum cinerariifolium TaxID=118510 RepID=A0A699JJ26_TANCI|nr:cation/H+ exchanger, cation/H+ exchanger, CPA1 family [Tanacetum cinerariifolium]
MCDNKAAIQISEKLEAGIIELPFVKSSDQLADILTKAVGTDMFHKYPLCSSGFIQASNSCWWTRSKISKSMTLAETIAIISCCISPTRHYLMKWDQDLVRVIVGKFGERVEVFKWDVSKAEAWEKIDSLGNHMIYICGTTCLCIQAKTREMENKIYFPILHSKNKKIVHYSLETCTFQTFNGENIQQHLDFFGTTHHLFPLCMD